MITQLFDSWGKKGDTTGDVAVQLTQVKKKQGIVVQQKKEREETESEKKENIFTGKKKKKKTSRAENSRSSVLPSSSPGRFHPAGLGVA